MSCEEAIRIVVRDFKALDTPALEHIRNCRSGGCSQLFRRLPDLIPKSSSSCNGNQSFGDKNKSIGWDGDY